MVLDLPLAVVGTSTWDSVINILAVGLTGLDEWCELRLGWMG